MFTLLGMKRHYCNATGIWRKIGAAIHGQPRLEVISLLGFLRGITRNVQPDSNDKSPKLHDPPVVVILREWGYRSPIEDCSYCLVKSKVSEKATGIQFEEIV